MPKENSNLPNDYNLIIVKTDNEDKRIYPVFDLHVGAKAFNERAWKKWKDEIKSDLNNYVVLGGDLLETATKNSVGDVYGCTMGPAEQKEWLYDNLLDIKDQIIAIVPGNHEHRITKDVGTCPIKDVAYRLGIQDVYRENMAFITVRFGDNKNFAGRDNPVYTIGITHGSSNGATPGAGANKNQKQLYSIHGMDLLISGHTHLPNAGVPICALYPDYSRGVMRHKQAVGMVATSWLDWSDYAIRKGYTPAALMPAIAILHGREKLVETRSWTRCQR